MALGFLESVKTAGVNLFDIPTTEGPHVGNSMQVANKPGEDPKWTAHSDSRSSCRYGINPRPAQESDLGLVTNSVPNRPM